MLLVGCAQRYEQEGTYPPHGAETQPRKLEVVFQYKMDYWSVYDLSYSSIPSQDKFEELTAEYLWKIPEFLDMKEWWRKVNLGADTLVLNLAITNDSSGGHSSYLQKALNNEVEADITLGSNRLMWQGSDGSLAHELTHTIMGQSFSIYLEDGLCEYIQDKVGSSNIMAPGLREQGISAAQCLKAIYTADKDKLLEEAVSIRLHSGMDTVDYRGGK